MATNPAVRGPVLYCVLFFINIKTRRVHIVGMTPNPDAAWMAERSCELRDFLDQQVEYRPTHTVRDRDGKFTEEFCSTLESNGQRNTPA
jgi:hypothetical protein